jgi:hypothetical protein
MPYRKVQLLISVNELKAFIGILIVIGFHSLPTIRLYWSTDPNFRICKIVDVMSLKWFLKILRFIHLNDINNIPKRNEADYDNLYRLRPLLSRLNKVIKEAFSPIRFLSVVESMVAFKGRSSLKQYMPLKPKLKLSAVSKFL